jgi:hypothetical protein
MNTPRVIRNASAAVVATIAATASYDHMRELALIHGQGELIASLVPISVDGMLVVATVAMHDDRISGRKVRPAAWVAFCVGVLASVTANVLAAPDDLISRIVSAWPAVALLLVIEVLATGGRKNAETAQASAQIASPERRISGSTKPVSGRRVSRRGKSVRRPVAHTRQLIAELRADQPGMTTDALARQLRISERRVRQLLATDA